MGTEGAVFEGRTLDDAVRKGLETLGLARAEVTIKVVAEGTGGFLGIGARPYKVLIMPRPGGAFAEPREERPGRGRRERAGRGGRDRGERPRGEDRGRGGAERRGERAGAERRGRPEERSGERRDERRRDERPRREPRREEPRREDRRRPEPARAEPLPEPAETVTAADPERAAEGRGDADEARRRRRRRRGGRGRGGEPRPAEAGQAPIREVATREFAEARPAASNGAGEIQGPALSSEQLVSESTRLTGELLKAMGFEATVTAKAEEDRVDVTAAVSGDEELLTGPKGEVRQALQHLLNRMLNRGEGSRYHLQLEVNEFWHRREAELESLARELAEEAVTAQSEVVTEYLNSQERRVVHMTLKTDARVKTYALGSGLIKRVAVAPADFPEAPQSE